MKSTDAFLDLFLVNLVGTIFGIIFGTFWDHFLGAFSNNKFFGFFFWCCCTVGEKTRKIKRRWLENNEVDWRTLRLDEWREWQEVASIEMKKFFLAFISACVRVGSIGFLGGSPLVSMRVHWWDCQEVASIEMKKLFLAFLSACIRVGAGLGHLFPLYLIFCPVI